MNELYDAQALLASVLGTLDDCRGDGLDDDENDKMHRTVRMAAEIIERVADAMQPCHVLRTEAMSVE
jgi:hypothetical protein